MTADRGWTSRAIRNLIGLLAATLLVTGLTVAGPPAASAAAPVATRSVTTRWSPGTYEHRVQALINRRRVAHGLHRLRFTSCADGTATRWSRHLASTDSFYHQDMGRVLSACRATYAGETLGRGGISPRRLVRLWMHSPAHRHVLLTRHASRIGIGSVVNARGEWVTAANFVRL